MLFMDFIRSIEPWMMWLIVAVLFLVAEAVSEALISIWFVVGALIAMVMALLGAPFWSQILVMLLVSVTLIILFLKNRDRMHLTTGFKSATNADRVIGKQGEVIQAIDPVEGTGQVKVRGVVWSAMTEDDTRIPVGTSVKVLEIRGVKLLVEVPTQPF